MINIYFAEGCPITDTNIVLKYTDNILIWLDYLPSVNTGFIFSLSSNGELSLHHLEFGLRKNNQSRIRYDDQYSYSFLFS